MAGLRTIPEALGDAARTGEGYTFVVGGVETRRTYAELQDRARGVARALRAAGLRPGEDRKSTRLNSSH